MLVAIGFASAFLIPRSGDFRRWGDEALRMIQRDLKMPTGELYGEQANPGQPPKHASFNWGVGVMLQALNAATELDPSYKPALAKFVNSTIPYWNSAGPVAGFDASPNDRKVDRYYDDNAWMVLGLADASLLLDSHSTLEVTKLAYKFVMSGEDNVLGGGIYWHEQKKTSKNTCVSAPAAAGALALYKLTQDIRYRDDAERLYAWTRAHLRDPDDGLYWDNIDLSGKVQKTKWSYNSGLMLLVAAELAVATGEHKYRDDAKELQRATLERWVSPQGTLRDDGKFIHLLVNAWRVTNKLVPGSADASEAIRQGVEFVHQSVRDSLGHYGNRWDKAADGKNWSPFALIDQASAARSFFEVANM